MAVRFDGTGRLTFAGRLFDGVDVVLVCWGGINTGADNYAWVSQSEVATPGRYVIAATRNTGNVQLVHGWSGGTDGDTTTKTPGTLNGTMRVFMGVMRSSGTNRQQCYYGDNSQGNGTAALLDQISNHDAFTVGAWNSGGSYLWPLIGDVAEVHAIAVGARTDADIDTLYDALAAGGLPEAQAGWIDGWKLTGHTDLTSIGGTRTLTLMGGVTTSPATHPVSRAPAAPIITGPSGAAGASTSTANVAENATQGPTFTTDIALGSGYPTLSGTHAANWALTPLTSTSWRVDPATPFNFEAGGLVNPQLFTFNASASVPQACTATITNVNEAPAFSGTISVPSLTEGVAMTPINVASMFTDPDAGESFTFSPIGTWPTGVTVSAAGVIGASPNGTPGTGTAAAYANLRVRGTSSGGLNVDSNLFTITVLAPGGGATAVTLTPPSPSSGLVGAASGNFTVAANGTITGTVTVTPSDGGGGGSFTPASVNISSGSPTATFTYTPGSAGTKAISVTNNGGLSNPAAASYVASSAPGTYTATVGPIGVAGIPSAAATVYWTLMMGNGPGGLSGGAQGTSVTDGSGNFSVSHSVAGAAVVWASTESHTVANANKPLMGQPVTLA